jgi:hypothetical protein
MENIVRLADYRRRRKPGRPATPAPAAGAQFYCTRCDGGAFHLSPLGMVHCAHCGALMRNLLVNCAPAPDAG